MRADVAKLEVQLQEREKQAGEFKELVSRLEQEVQFVPGRALGGIVPAGIVPLYAISCNGTF